MATIDSENLKAQNNYWKSRWDSNEIAWHRSAYHPALVKHWPQLAKRSRVLVPLCGKTHDMIWLAEQGLQVFGVELVQVAVEQFFSDFGLNYHSHYSGNYQHFQCVELSIHIIVGDFFKLTKEDIPFDSNNSEFDALYDRAALVALPDTMRQEYAQQCLNLLKNNYSGLLITFDYLQSEMQGPPYAVLTDELNDLYLNEFREVERFDLLVEGSPFYEKGFSSFAEVTWLKSSQ